jgi:hypothetical protein
MCLRGIDKDGFALYVAKNFLTVSKFSIRFSRVCTARLLHACYVHPRNPDVLFADIKMRSLDLTRCLCGAHASSDAYVKVT